MDQFSDAVDALTHVLGEGLGPRDDITVHRIPPCGLPVLYLVTLRGTAKVYLERLFELVTNREERRSVGIWALDRSEVESLMRVTRTVFHMKHLVPPARA